MLWRRCLLGVSGFAIAMWCVSIALQLTTSGQLGAFHVPSGTPFVARLIVGPGSAAFQAGVRTGDEVDVRALSTEERYRFLNRALAGSTMHFPILRHGRSVRIAVTPRHVQIAWWAILGWAGTLWFSIFAVFFALRRSEDVAVRVLVIMLSSFTLTAVFGGNWVTPWLPLDVAANLLGLLASSSTVLLATYALQFAKPISRPRRILTGATYAVFAADMLLQVINQAAGITTTIDPFNRIFSDPTSILAQTLVPFVLPLICVLAAMRAARGSERLRLAWATAPIALFYVSYLAASVLQSESTNYPLILAALILQNLSTLLLPIGLTYALLSRRLLDIGFVLNRAAIFSGVSIVIVGAFILAEWAISEWLAGASHSTNVAISAALALALGLSVRAVHHRVDTIVDSVFFHRRHEDEKAILTFARTCAHITDSQTLLQRAAETLERHADASAVTFALADEAGHYGDVSENDPALVMLRARGEIVDLHAFDTELRGEFAYPMIARGRLIGALIIGPKRSGESYAPDESEAVMQLARDTGTALYALNECTPDRDATAALTLLTEKIDAHFAALPGQIAAALREDAALR